MTIFVKTLKGTYSEIEENPEDTGIPEQAEVPPVARAHATNPPAQPPLPAQPAPVPSSGTNANPLDPSPQGLPDMGSDAAGGGNLGFLSNSPGANPQLLWHIRNLLWQLAVIVTPEEREAIERAPQASAAPLTSTPVSAAPQPSATTLAPPASVPAPAPAPAPAAAPASSVTDPSSDVYGQAASNLVAGNNLEGAIQRILDMGGGTWDRDTVVHAVCAAFNDRERAVEYLNAGLPEQAGVPPVARAHASGQVANPPAQPPLPAQPAPVPSSGPNANLLDLSPQGLPDMGSDAAGGGNLDFLRNSQEFQHLRAVIKANPQLMQPMLRELGKLNLHLLRLIQEHQADFVRLINEPIEGGEGNLLGQLASGMPQAIPVTPEEHEAIERDSGSPSNSLEPSHVEKNPIEATENDRNSNSTCSTSPVPNLRSFFFAVNGVIFSKQSPRIGRACNLSALVGVILPFTVLLWVLLPPIFCWAPWVFFAFTCAAFVHQYGLCRHNGSK